MKPTILASLVLSGFFTLITCNNGIRGDFIDVKDLDKFTHDTDVAFSDLKRGIEIPQHDNTLETRATATSPLQGTSTVLCGAVNNGSVCVPGMCCSGYNNCGIGDLYCGNGCQPGFGNCGTQPTSAFAPGPTGSTTTCGPTNGNAVCKTGLCCSSKGFCGTGPTYCADPACLYNFGTCDSDSTPAGQSTRTDPRPLLGNLTYTKDIFHCSVPNVIALTFDDGPDLNYTSGILDLLKQYGFHATFFVCGNNLGKGAIDVTAPYPDLLKRMINEGHQIASHTWSHYNLDDLPTPKRIEQLVKNERAIANIIQMYPTYLRPPYSGCQNSTGCQQDVATLGYHRVYFDFDTDDYLNDSPLLIQNSKNKVTAALNNVSATYNDILSIQHDIVRNSANLTAFYFQAIKAKGWKGVAVGECLADDRSNWYRTPGTGAGVPFNNLVPVSSSSSNSNSSSSSSGNPSSSSSSPNGKSAAPPSLEIGSSLALALTLLTTAVIGI